MLAYFIPRDADQGGLVMRVLLGIERRQIDHSSHTRRRKVRYLRGSWHAAAQESVRKGEEIVDFLNHYFTRTALPPVIFCRSSGVNSKMAFGVPAAAQMVEYCRRSSSR